MIVDSQIQACGWATSSALERLDEGPGTTFTAIAPDGTVTHPTLDLDPTFVAWSASSADASLALVGTIGIRHDGGSYVAGTRDVVVMRRSKSTGGRFVANVIARGEGQGLNRIGRESASSGTPP